MTWLSSYCKVSAFADPFPLHFKTSMFAVQQQSAWPAQVFWHSMFDKSDDLNSFSANKIADVQIEHAAAKITLLTETHDLDQAERDMCSLSLWYAKDLAQFQHETFKAQMSFVLVIMAESCRGSADDGLWRAPFLTLSARERKVALENSIEATRTDLVPKALTMYPTGRRIILRAKEKLGGLSSSSDAHAKVAGLLSTFTVLGHPSEMESIIKEHIDDWGKVITEDVLTNSANEVASRVKTLLCIGSLDEPSLLAEEAMEEVLSQAESENNIHTP